MSFSALLTVLFIALKLTHVIAWSWVWVLAPFWIGVVLWFVVFAGVLVVKLAGYNRRHGLRRR